jgi:hypothetical protein
MAHNNRIRPIGDAWLTILPSELGALEAGLVAGINGDDGGTYAPSAAIDIGGTQGLVVTGPTLVARGGLLFGPDDDTSILSPTYNLLDGDWVQLDPSNVLTTRTPFQSMLNARPAAPSCWQTRIENGSIQALASAVDQQFGDGMEVMRAWVPLDVHDGGTLTQVEVFFHVGAFHTDLPPVMPSVRVVRQDAQGNVVVLSSTTAGADPNGYVYVPTPTSAAAWTNAFQTQSLVVPCDQNNVVDRGTYAYFVEIVEEQGLTGYPWQLSFVPGNATLVATTGNSTLFNLPVIDGVDLSGGGTLTGGDLILVKAQNDPTQNGLWISQVTNWIRYPYFTRGMLVRVFAGLQGAFSLWQASTNTTQWSPPTTPPTPGAQNLTFVGASESPFPTEGSAIIAHGISWHGMQGTYTKIPDLRPD